MLLLVIASASEAIQIFPVSKSRQGAREDKLDCVVASAPRHDETAISGLLQALATPEKMIVQMKLVITTHRRCRAASCAVHRPFKPDLLDA